MTSTRPEQGGSPHDDAYGDRASFEAAVDGLDDPLNDPLPGRHPSPWFRTAAPQPEAPAAQPQEEWYDPQGYQRDWYGEQGPGPTSYGTGHGEGAAYGSSADGSSYGSAYDPGYAGSYDNSQAYGGGQNPAYDTRPPTYQDPISQAAAHRPPMDAAAYEAMYDHTQSVPAVSGETVSLGATAPPPVSGETIGLRQRSGAGGSRPMHRIADDPRPSHTAADTERPGDDETVGLRTSDTRRAALRRQVPGLSRLEARRAERAKRPSPAVLASRALGEVFITIGVLMLLFVTYQLWWTNVLAGQQAGAERNKIEEGWANGKGKPGAFEPGQGFAIMYIPKLDVVVPIAEGISKPKVLDRGMVGHYGEESIKTAMPGDKKGNFAVAGHRNTHGEPFRYINKLEPGDPIIVETQDTYYVYKMASILPQTTPDNVSVLNPVPKGSGFTKPGRYITLTTCTPEFTSTYRMIVWGQLAEERPRDKGKPSALVE
ncbi:class E sortase [Streptomyces mesophilus]|uniref:class E sortase n=1 Tax=Streptomyces mesophilus TaxID=1775132 RepID=UPI00332AE226